MIARQATRKIFKSPIAVTLALVLLIATAGTAFAYWTAHGSGSQRQGANATTADLVISQTGTAVGLYPGASASVAGTISNPNNAFSLTLESGTQVTATVTGTDAGTNCTAANFSVTGTATVSGTLQASGGNSLSWSGLTLNMLNTSSNQDGCKGAKVELSFATS